MFLFKKTLRRVLGGRKETGTCSNCHNEGMFHETEIVEKLAALWVIDLLDDVERFMQCGECLALVKMEDAERTWGKLDAPVKTANPPALLEAKKVEAKLPWPVETKEATPSTPEAKPSTAEAELRARSQRGAELYEVNRRRGEAEIDAELEALKRRLGK